MDKGFMHTFEVGNFHLNHMSLFNQELVMYINRSTDPEELRGSQKSMCRYPRMHFLYVNYCHFLDPRTIH